MLLASGILVEYVMGGDHIEVEAKNDVNVVVMDPVMFPMLPYEEHEQA